MDIITGNKNDLKLLIDGAYQRLRNCKDNMERYALIDYLTQLHELDEALTGRKSSFDERRANLSNSQQRRYMKYLDSLFGRLEEEFCKGVIISLQTTDNTAIPYIFPKLP